MVELPPRAYRAVEKLFGELDFCLSIQSVLFGPNPGRVFADRSNAPRAAMVYSPEGIYFGGSPDDTGFLQDLNRLLREDVFPQALARGALQYTVFFPPAWEAALAAVFASCHIMRDERRYFEHDLAHLHAEAAEDTAAVDEAMLTGPEIDGLADLRREIEKGWGTAANYLGGGFGRAVVADGAIAAWCLTDCVVGDRCEIGVETEDRYRRQGLGTRVVLGELRQCRARGIRRVGWHCWTSNEASRRTAQKAGFREARTVDVYFGWYDQTINLLINGNHYLGRKDYARAAAFYAGAIDKGRGWDWHYYNAACAAWRSGDPDGAARFYRLAVAKGWRGLENMLGHELYGLMYQEPDAAGIEAELRRLLETAS